MLQRNDNGKLIRSYGKSDMPVVQKDAEGFFIETNHSIYRPATYSGLPQAVQFAMDDIDVQIGHIVRSKTIPGTSLCRIVTSTSVHYWHRQMK